MTDSLISVQQLRGSGSKSEAVELVVRLVIILAMAFAAVLVMQCRAMLW
jgi:hypothetical protein